MKNGEKDKNLEACKRKSEQRTQQTLSERNNNNCVAYQFNLFEKRKEDREKKNFTRQKNDNENIDCVERVAKSI